MASGLYNLYGFVYNNPMTTITITLWNRLAARVAKAKATAADNSREVIYS